MKGVLGFGGPAAQTRSLVNKATSDDRNPPSGFVLKEVSRKTFDSIEECNIIEDTLMKRIEKDRPYIRLKCLRVIKYVCENGRPEFRIMWQRNSDRIRACAQYKGPPDPIYGDTPYQQVRTAAKDTMAAIFKSTQKDTSKMRNRIKGFGGHATADTSDRAPAGIYGGSIAIPPSQSSASSFASGGGGGGGMNDSGGMGFGKKMQGFGNTSYNPNKPTQQSGWKSSMMNYLGKANTGVERPTFSAHSGSGVYSGAVVGSQSVAPTASLNAETTRSGQRRRGQVGGAWGTATSETIGQTNNQMNNAPNYGGGAPSARPAPAAPAPVKTTPSNVGASSNGEYEATIINEITMGGGVRPAPTRDEMNRFLNSYPTLDQDAVHELLEERLFEGTAQQQLKCMYLIDAVLKKDFGTPMSEFFRTNPDCINNLANNKKKTLRNKVMAVRRALGLTGAPASTSAPAQPASDQGDLLYGAAPTQPAAPKQQAPDDLGDLLFGGGAPTQPAAPSGGGDDMFGDMVTSSAPAPNNDDSLLSFSAAVESPPPAQPTTFDPLSMMSNGSAPASTAPQTAPAESDGGGFSFMKAAPSSNPTPPTDAFAGLSMGGNNNAPSGGGAFGLGGGQSNGFGLSGTSQPQSSGFNLGGTSQPQNTGGFNLGGNSQASTGFNLGGTQPQGNSGFNMGGTQPSGFGQSSGGFGAMSTPQKGGGGFGSMLGGQQNQPMGVNNQRTNAPSPVSADPFGFLVNPKQPTVCKATEAPKSDPFSGISW